MSSLRVSSGRKDDISMVGLSRIEQLLELRDVGLDLSQQGLETLNRFFY